MTTYAVRFGRYEFSMERAPRLPKAERDDENFHPILFDFELGRFSVIAQRERFRPSIKFKRTNPGTVNLDLPWCSVMFCNETAEEAHADVDSL
ncbi:MAG: hypothetical protein N4A70_20710 [Pelagimonas sp.]|jgi:hypothetical protein|nr:hypothetical protein [Pelagimonas sp.]